MTDQTKWEMALKEFHRELKRLYGANLKSLVLYGSRARGDAENESDIDLLVVLASLSDFWHEFHELHELSADLSLKHGVVISVFPVTEHQYETEFSPLMINVRREGILVS